MSRIEDLGLRTTASRMPPRSKRLKAGLAVTAAALTIATPALYLSNHSDRVLKALSEGLDFGNDVDPKCDISNDPPYSKDLGRYALGMSVQGEHLCIWLSNGTEEGQYMAVGYNPEDHPTKDEGYYTKYAGPVSMKLDKEGESNCITVFYETDEYGTIDVCAIGPEESGDEGTMTITESN